MLESGEVADVGGVVANFYGEAFFGELIDASAGALSEIFMEFGFGGGEIEEPSVGGVNVSGFNTSVIGHYFGF